MGLNQSNPKDEDRTIKEFDKVKDIVIKFLRDLPETRNSDKLLYYVIMKEIFLTTDLKDNIPKALFLDTLWELLTISPDKSTIVRVRRQIQNVDWIFQPTDPAVLKKRKIRSSDISDWAGDN